MAELENLLSELPNIIDELNLNIGSRKKMKDEILRLNHILSSLGTIQEAIESELGFEKIKNAAIGALPFLGTVASVFIPGGFLVDAMIAGGASLLAEKFGNTDTEITLSDLQDKMYEWIGWVHDLKEIAEHILHDGDVLNQINTNLNSYNINNKLQKINNLIKINLALNNSDLLIQQINQITHAQDDLIKLQQKLVHTSDILKNSNDIYQLLIGLSNFYGNAGLSLEWLDDEHGLIVASSGELTSLAEIISNCEYFQEKVGDLILNGNDLRTQAEEALHRLENNHKNQHELNKQNLKQNQGIKIETINQKQKKYIFKSSIIIALISTISAFVGAWIVKDKLPQIQQILLNTSLEENAITNFKSAQKMGMEASLMVQNPPHPLQVWQNSHIKWQEAISLLEKIPEGTSVYKQATTQISTYQNNSQAILKRILTEKKALDDFESAQKLAIEAAILGQNPPHPAIVWKQARDKWQQAINLLETIPESTFVSTKAKEKLSIYKNNYSAVSTQVKN
ncbi:hypothetical protein [Nostoc sp. CMAA1605]|uniref:hypothetical protein n=1 Tax=Nostoc sp. CMAA1605 TaxID=2055159 RepID=UPI001F37B0C5|nr:hypothetical protein [Nostoc sp. CMAA1605]MCF4968398.1 hypothetical protein [Nostoc sp. CMAA1605]